MNIAIIPARSGSKRIPRKNVKPFLGFPIIKYSIQAALESNLFTKVIVSTDCNEIKQISESFGAEVPFLRSSLNSSDTATTLDVLKEVCDEISNKNHVDFNNVCCIYPTAPLMTSKSILDSFEAFTTGKYTSLIPVTKYEFSVYRSLKVENDKTVSWLFPEFANTRSQDLSDVFHDVGQFYWLKKSFIKTANTILDEKCGHFEIDPMFVQDIDDEKDWKIAEFKFNFNKNYELQNLKNGVNNV